MALLLFLGVSPLLFLFIQSFYLNFIYFYLLSCNEVSHIREPCALYSSEVLLHGSEILIIHGVIKTEILVNNIQVFC